MQTITPIISANTKEQLRFAPKRSSLISPVKQNCSIQRQCESCLYVNDDYSLNLKRKFQMSLKTLEDKDLLTRTRILPPTASEQVFSYRTTLKLAVRKSKDGLLNMGLFRPGTHDVVEITQCPLHLPILQKLLGRVTPLLQSFAKENKLTPWDESTQEGDLRYLVARASHITDEIQITFVVTNTDKKNLFRDLIRDLKQNGFNIVSAFLNINTSSGNDIYGEEFLKLAGQDQLRTPLHGSLFAVSPATFLQVNPWQAETIYNRIVQFGGVAERGELAWDLYCGMGPIALALAKQHFRVWGVEENPHAISDAKANRVRNSVPEAQVSFTCGLLEDSLDAVPLWAENPSLIVINPSRRGLAESVRNRLHTMLSTKNKLQHILYLSCEVKTLARDLEHLLSSGARLNQIEAFDMFPHTDKLEWLAVITPAVQ